MRRDNNFVFCLLLTVLFAGSIFWINFHAAFWYDMDMALNSRVAQLMWDEETFFPENWIFGNQYFILETPNLAALFYGLTHQTTLSMSLASSLWVFLIVGTFIWCLKPFIQKKWLVVGVLCLVGGIIFGTSAASYTKGLQVLYTMASYYACYLEVLLLSIGGWLRLSSARKLPWASWCLILILNFAVGMHSLREMLILGLPLVALSAMLLVFNKENRSALRNALWLAFLILLAEGMGHVLIKHLNIPSCSNISGIQTEWRLDLLFANFLNASKNLLRISGIAFIKDGIKYIPLFFCALCVAFATGWALITLIRRRDASPLSRFILFSWISILAVFSVGVFFFQTRDIYFFIYWLLSTLSIVYLFTQSNGKRVSWLTGGLCLIAIVNYGYNFLPDFIDHHRYASQMVETTERLIDEGYTTLYGDDCAVFAAASKDKIVAAPIRLGLDQDAACPLVVFPYNKDLSLYDEVHGRHAVICISNYYLNRPDFQINRHCSELSLHTSFLWREREILLLTPNHHPLFE